MASIKTAVSYEAGAGLFGRDVSRDSQIASSGVLIGERVDAESIHPFGHGLINSPRALSSLVQHENQTYRKRSAIPPFVKLHCKLLNLRDCAQGFEPR